MFSPSICFVISSILGVGKKDMIALHNFIHCCLLMQSLYLLRSLEASNMMFLKVHVEMDGSYF